MFDVDPELDVAVYDEGMCPGCNKRRAGPAQHKHLCKKCLDNLYDDRDQPADPAMAARQEIARRELCRRRFLPFIQRMVPGYQVGWFHADLAARLERFSQRVERGEAPRLILNTPPRHGKSEQASKGLPAWHLGRHPHHRVISTTHSDRLAVDNSRDVLTYVRSPRYTTVFPDTQLDKENKGAMGWRTTQGGMYKPAGVGAGISGYGADIFIIDDPHRDRDAYSPTVRENIWQWYKSSARTRLLPGAGMLIIQTRWVMDDLTGRVLDEEGGIDEGGLWEVVCYPAEATRDEYRMPNGRLVHQPQEGATLLRRQGELLHPERFSHEDLEQHRADPVTWAALYQQDPTAGEAGQFSRELIDACACTSGDIPKRLTRYTAWDTAQGIKEVHDYCAGLTVGVDENEDVWFLDLVHERFAPDELVEAIIDNYFQFRQQLVGIEKTQYVVGLEASFDRRLYERGGTSLPLELLPHGNKDKVARSKPIQVWMRQGRVHIPTDAPWYNDLRKELIDFPGGRHDDIVDVVSYIGQMLDDMTTPFVPAGARNQEAPGWRNALREMQTRQGQGRRRSWKTA